MASHKTRVKHMTQTHRVVEKKIEKGYTTYDVHTISIGGPFSDPSCTEPPKSSNPKPQPRSSQTNSGSQRSGLHAPRSADVDESALPFAVPKSEKDHEKINCLLRYCKEQQREFDITNRPGFVEIILHRCLQALGVKSTVLYGYRDVSGPTSQAHVWLKINEHYIDNAYWGCCKDSARYLQQHYPHCYTPCQSFERTKPPHPRISECEYKKKRIEFFAANPDCGLALCLNREQSYNFFFAMIRYMFDEHKVYVQGIAPQIRYHCWRCFKFPKAGLSHLSNIMDDDSENEDCEDNISPAPGGASWKFLQCPSCMVASYCSRKCQVEDYALGHGINCLPKDIPFMSESF